MTEQAEQRRCVAHNQVGQPCRQRPIRGGSVCVAHGGRAPQVKRKAEERIRDLVDPAISRLAKLIEDDISGVALAAVKDVLDRAGYSVRQRVEHTGADGGPIEFDEWPRMRWLIVEALGPYPEAQRAVVLALESGEQNGRAD
jgi:hypothetical protein